MHEQGHRPRRPARPHQERPSAARADPQNLSARCPSYELGVLLPAIALAPIHRLGAIYPLHSYEMVSSSCGPAEAGADQPVQKGFPLPTANDKNRAIAVTVVGERRWQD